MDRYFALLACFTLGYAVRTRLQSKSVAVDQDPLNVEQLKSAFQSLEGLTLRVADPRTRTNSGPSSATVWRNDLPLGLFFGVNVEDRIGIIFDPKSVEARCAYTNNANTNNRGVWGGPTGIVKDACNSSLSIAATERAAEQAKLKTNMSGQCNFSTPEDYVEAYRNISTFRQSWLCHFTNVPQMLEAQREFLNQSNETPADLPRATWLEVMQHTLTSFNEVVIEPHGADSVAGIFWAHGGHFRDPLPTEREACEMASYLSSGENRLPVFELAGVALQNYGGDALPFGPSSLTSEQKEQGLDWLSEAIDQWRANLTAGDGQRDGSSVFRQVEETAFTGLLTQCKLNGLGK